MENIIQSIMQIDVRGVAAKENINGDELDIKLDSGIAYVSESSLTCITNPNLNNWNYNVDKNLSYNLWIAQNKPAIALAVTAEHMRNAFKYAKCTLLKSNVFKMLKIPGINEYVVFRIGDLLNDDDFNAFYNDPQLNVHIVSGAKTLRTAIDRTHSFKTFINENSDFPLLLLLVNCCHRTLTKGHNFFSHNMDDITTYASKCGKFAGERKDSFSVFLKEYGHDMWHAFTDSTLKTICDAITGANVVMIPANTHFNGRDYLNDGNAIHSVLKLEQAALDRYPPGNVGISAIILGIPCVIYMLQSIASRVNVLNLDAVTISLETLSNRLSKYAFRRADIVDIKAKLSETIAMAYGYGTATSYFEDAFKAHKSLIAVANAHPVQRATGSELGKYVRTLEPNAYAMQASIASVVSALLVNLNAVGNIAGIDEVGPQAR